MTDLSNAQPPPKTWVVTLHGHIEDVHDMLEEILNVFGNLNPNTNFEDEEDDDLSTVTIRMDWNSIELERLLWSIHQEFTFVRMTQNREV